MQPMDYDIERRATTYGTVEIYGDLGFIKNKQLSARFLYDSGIRLNLVPDYFELYLPSIRLTAGNRRKNYNQKYGLLLLYQKY
jgi:hypothetical protein